MFPQVAPRTEAPSSSGSSNMEKALPTSAHSTDEALPKRPGSKHSKGVGLVGWAQISGPDILGLRRG